MDVLRNMLDSMAGYDRQAAKEQRERTREVAQEARSARQEALDAIAQLPGRRPGPLDHEWR